MKENFVGRLAVFALSCLFFAGCGKAPARPDFLTPIVSSKPEEEIVPSPAENEEEEEDQENEEKTEQDQIEKETVSADEQDNSTTLEAPPAASASVSEPLEKSPPVTLVKPKVVINELFYDAVGSDTNGVLFVELAGDAEAKIGGYQLVFVNGEDGKGYDTLTLPAEAKTGSDGFYLIADAKNGSTEATFVAGADWVTNFDPQNGPDSLQWLDDEGELVDLVGYGTLTTSLAENDFPTFEGSTTADVVNGHSLERKSPGLDTDNNADDFAEREVPTPGK